MILAAALEVNSYEELRRSAIASGVPGTLRFVLILSRFRYELLSQHHQKAERGTADVGKPQRARFRLALERSRNSRAV
ncbi:MAG: hypothetical protein DMG41_17555 [Acidobacteria bacterium]|nr:MAG: hypothetical protein DMG42_16395 [Acidobacteriota bacterium]PYT86942.1 MAG: hypothetical protein DMG41_17555 [Acidobacteriota bacterium]